MLLRIGDKIINRHTIHRIIDDILEMRSHGLSQQEVAKQIRIDRTFVSRLENIGEIRKGGTVALIGFPIKNCVEIRELCQVEGIDYCFVMTEQQRWSFVETKTGIELFNQVMDIAATLRQYDIVIILGSNMRIKLVEALLDKKVIGLQIGESPIEDDKYVNPDDIRTIMRQLHA